jgi:phage terminase large subunit-like protein
MAKQQEPSLGDLFDLAFTEIEQANRRGNALTYVPYSDQVGYHSSQTRGRYATGGNRAGKTDAQVLDMYWTATDSHPYRDRDRLHPTWGHGPVNLRWFAPDVEKGIKQILLPKLRRWVPRSACINGDFFESWDPQAGVFTFENGSTLDVLTYGMSFEKLGGVPRHAVYFDEEPPLEIFNETMMRLRDYNGEWSIAATPVNGITWTYDRLVEPAENYWNRVGKLGFTPTAPKGVLPSQLEEGEVRFISVHTLDPANNPYLDADEEAVEELTVAMDKEERDIREHGKFVAKSGNVFPNFSRETHVLDVALPLETFKSWRWYSSVDVGWSNPTAWLWHAVAPDGRIYTFAEHYASKMTVAEHSQVVLERERAWGKTPEIRTGDPAMKQVTGQTGTSYLIEYGRHGIGIGVEGIPHDVQIGVEKMQQYVQVQPWTPWGENTPTWMISPNCPNLIRELKKLRWATYDSTKMTYDRNKKEEIHKKDDHASDSARYFFTMMPNLAPVADIHRPGAEVPLGSYADIMARVVAGRQKSLESIATTTWTMLDYDEGEY